MLVLSLAVGILVTKVHLAILAVPVVLLLFSIGFRYPISLVMLLIVTNIDMLQLNYVFYGATLFQLVAGLLLVVCVARSALALRSPTEPIGGIGIPLILVTGGFLAFSFFRATGTDFTLLFGNAFRLLVVWVILIEIRSLKTLAVMAAVLELLGTVTALAVVLAFFQPNLPLWQHSLFYEHGTYLRVWGFERDPNYAALKLLMIVPFILAPLGQLRIPIQLMLRVSQLTLIIGAILMTGSRAGLITTAVVLLIWIYWARRNSVSQWRLSGLAVVILILAIVIGQSFWESTLNRLLMPGRTINDIYRAEYTARWYRVTAGLMEFAQSPFLGRDFSAGGFHNTYVDLLAGYGFIGSIPLAAMTVYVVVKQLFLAFSRLTVTGISQFAFAIGLSLIAWGVMGATIGAQRELVFWIVLGMGLALLKLGGKDLLQHIDSTKGSEEVGPIGF